MSSSALSTVPNYSFFPSSIFWNYPGWLRHALASHQWLLCFCVSDLGLVESNLTLDEVNLWEPGKWMMPNYKHCLLPLVKEESRTSWPQEESLKYNLWFHKIHVLKKFRTINCWKEGEKIQSSWKASLLKSDPKMPVVANINSQEIIKCWPNYCPLENMISNNADKGLTLCL